MAFYAHIATILKLYILEHFSKVYTCLKNAKFLLFFLSFYIHHKNQNDIYCLSKKEPIRNSTLEKEYKNYL